MDTNTPTPASSTDEGHLVVLVHGLWGNPAHLQFLNDSLREQFAQDNLHILVPKSNAGNFTYDGIELGGERVTSEIEERLRELAKSGVDINRISVIGYSLGGLIARYAIGLLYHKGIFESIQPINFTTFATPHLGVRTPLTGATNYIWNVLGARTLSKSGEQLYMVDKFRDTGRPLLAVLADPASVFVRALASFKNRSVYANVVNDRTVSYYTSAFSETDPFADMDAVECNYVEGYEQVILDGRNPVFVKEREELALTQRLTKTTGTIFRRIPMTVFLMIFLPIGTTLFLVNSAIQSVKSGQRIRLHEEGKAGINVSEYRIPLISDMRREVQDLYENINSAHEREYLSASDEETATPDRPHRRPSLRSVLRGAGTRDTIEELKSKHSEEFPTLALTSDQFAIIESLDNIGFKKHPVYIHKHRHSHAAIIRRRTGAAFEEGRIVIKHWLDSFEL